MSAFNGAHTHISDAEDADRRFAKDKESNRDIVMIVDEEILNECAEPRQMVGSPTSRSKNRPMMISSYTAKEASGSVLRPGRAVRCALFQRKQGAGFLTRRWRSFRTSTMVFARSICAIPTNPTKWLFHPIQSPPQPTALRQDRRQDRCRSRSNQNVETDERGYIYIVDRANTGLHILD